MRLLIRQLHNLDEAGWQQELYVAGLGMENVPLPDTSIWQIIKISGPQPSELTALGAVFGEQPDVRVLQSPQASVEQHLFVIFSPMALFGFSFLFRDGAEGVSNEFIAGWQTFLMRNQKREWLFDLPGGKSLSIHRPLVMGILNITPDSFSDGGQFAATEAACKHAMQMLEDGADIIDIGGESTRPGAQGVDAEQEWARIGSVVERMAKIDDCIISVDTYKSEVARRALESGAHIINDISGALFDPSIATVAARYNAPLILMHIQGKPRTMQKQPTYKLLMEDIFLQLQNQCEFARSQGVRQLMIDPGIGFGKTVEHNLEILRRLPELRGMGLPILLGTSRKSFIGKILDAPVESRLSGTLATNIVGVQHGASVLRVHDVREHVAALKILDRIFFN